MGALSLVLAKLCFCIKGRDTYRVLVEVLAFLIVLNLANAIDIFDFDIPTGGGHDATHPVPHPLAHPGHAFHVKHLSLILL